METSSFVSRKEKRKQKKQIKKLQNVAYARRQKIETVMKEVLGASKKKKKKKSKNQDPVEQEPMDIKVQKSVIKDKDDDVHLSKAAKQRKRQFEEESDDDGLTYEQYLKDVAEKKKSSNLGSEQDQEDDIAISRYSKLLGLKPKSKKVPKAFTDDGLDMLLEFCNAEDRSDLIEVNAKAAMAGEDLEEPDESESENEDLIDLNEDSDLEEPPMDSSEEDEEYEELMTDCDDDVDDEDLEENDGDITNVKEDIYGRRLDTKSGELIKFDPKAANKKLVELEGSLDLESKRKVDRSVTGIINRLSEATLIKSKVAFQEIYASSPKNDVKSSLATVLWKMIGAPYRLPDNMLSTYGMFLALIHGIVDTEISSHFVEYFVCDYIKVIKTDKVQDDKSVENKTITLSHIINYKIVKPEFAIDILKNLSDNLDIDNLQIIYTFASYVYKTAKRCCWVPFAEILSQIHIQYQNSPLVEISRAQFIAENILALKKAAPGHIDYSMFESHYKMFRGLLKQEKTEISQELGMGVDDLLHATDRGRWWIVGSAFRLPSDSYSVLATDNKKITNALSFPNEVLELAAKAKMNTVIRKNIFCSIAVSSGEDEAFEKLLRLSLKGQQEREIIYVIIHMMLKEKSYNPYYATLISRFCEFDRKFKITSQYALWDRIRECNNLSKKQRTHLASLLHILIRNEVLSITVLKVVEWGSINSFISSVIRHVFVLLEDCPEGKLRRIFTPALSPEKNQVLTEGLRLFLQINFSESEVYRKVDTWFSNLL